MSKVFVSRSEPPRGLGRDQPAIDSAIQHHRFPTMVTVAWLSLGIASVALALIAALVLRSERESTAILHHLNVISLNLQDVLSDLAEAEAEARGYVLTGRGSSLENFERSNKALDLEFDRLTALVKNNPAERQEVERVRSLVQQDLDELQKSIASRTAAGSQAAFAEILTDRARKLTEALRQSITGIGEEQEGTLARLARRRRVRLSSALGAVSGALLLAAAYLVIGQIIIARGASRRQRAEEALRASEKRFKALCEQSPVGIYSTDALGLCVYTNPRWSQMSGLSAAENLGHGWTKALHPDDRETVFESWKTNALQGTSWEFRLVTPEGEIRWIRALGGPIYSDRGEVTGYVGTVEDITERKYAHRALEEREALNRAVLNSLPANIAVLNRDGTIQAINEEWRRSAESYGDPPAWFVHPGVNYLEVCKRAAGGGSSDVENALTGIQDVLTGKRQVFGMEYPFHSAAEKRWFRMTVTPLAGVATGGVVISYLDITERKRAEDSVREALEQLQLITDNMSAGVTRCSRDLRYVWVNPQYAAWLGLAPQEITGRAMRDVIGEEIYGDIRPHIEKVLRGERGEVEIQLPLPEAGRRWIRAVYVPTRDQDHNVDGWISVIADVTERHEAEERLRESEERFRNMADTAPVMIWGSGSDKLCTFFNQVWLDFRGRALEQELGNGWAEGVHPDDLDRTLAIYSSSFDARQRFQLEYRLRRADGTYRWLLGSGVPRFTAGGVFQGYIGSSIDVTDFKKAQERFRLVVEASPTAMVMVDGEGKIVLVNSRTEKLFGYGRQELAGQPVEILVPESLRDTHLTLRNEYLLQPIARQMGKGLDLSGRRKDGTQFLIEIGLAPIETEDGSCVLSSLVDISERKLAEEKLRDSEERFRATFFQAAVGMSQTTIDGHWLLLNDRLCEILGYSHDELVGKRFYDFTHPDDREASLAAVRQLLAGEISSSLIEKRYIRKDGVPVWVKVFMSLVRGPHNEAFLVRVVEDINERRQAQEKLRESEERFRNMADTAPVMIWTSGPDKRCTFLNKVWLDFTGRSVEQELGFGWTEGVHPDDLERFWAVYSSAFDARRSFQMDGRLRRADGAYRWLLAHGVPRFTADDDFHGYIGSCIDITERIRAEEERQKFVSLADSSMEFVGMCDLDFQPFYINAAGMRLVGLDNLEEAFRVKVQDCFFPEDQPFITNEFFPRVLLDGHGKVEIRFRHFKTAEAIWMIYNVFNICDAHGATVGWATVSVDITERRRAERALQESRQELRALAGRLINAEEQERKRISRELHDDLNQKLACLAFDADSLRLMPFSSEAKIREQLFSLRTQIVELSQDVREISHRLHPSILDDLGLTAALDELSQEFSTRERLNVEFTQEAVPPAIPAEVAACLYRVAQEAIHNVLKHARADYVRMSLSGDSRGIHLSIYDTGAGFDSEAGFRRPGLGIVSMKERVLLVHGEFSIHSQPGQGTEVRVFVPLPNEALRAA